MAYTLGQAAKAVGRNKATLSAAIKKGRISASKDENGIFQIDPAELFRVYPQDGQPNGGQAAGKQSHEHSKNNPLEAHLKVLEELVSELRADKKAAAEREADLRRDLDQWRGFAFDAQQRLKALEAPKPEPMHSEIIEAEAVRPSGTANKENPWWMFWKRSA